MQDNSTIDTPGDASRYHSGEIELLSGRMTRLIGRRMCCLVITPANG